METLVNNRNMTDMSMGPGMYRLDDSKNRNKIDVDGGMGPATLKAVQNLSTDRVRAYRVLRFANIVIDKPNQEKFWVGWFRRATEV